MRWNTSGCSDVGNPSTTQCVGTVSVWDRDNPNQSLVLKPPTRSWVNIGYIPMVEKGWDDLRMDLRRSDPASIDKAASES